jgi:hypothetical protein
VRTYGSGPRLTQRAATIVTLGSTPVLYTIDKSMIYVIRTPTDAARTTLEDVSKALGSETSALPQNVPAAAELLRVRAEGFRRVERECIDYAAQLRQHVDALR